MIKSFLLLHLPQPRSEVCIFFSAALSGPVLFHPEGSSAGSQGRCCAELYYGTVLGDAIASVIGY